MCVPGMPHPPSLLLPQGNRHGMLHRRRLHGGAKGVNAVTQGPVALWLVTDRLCAMNEQMQQDLASLKVGTAEDGVGMVRTHNHSIDRCSCPLTGLWDSLLGCLCR